MCGIVGFNWSDRKLIKKMADAIKHRGPDQEGFFVDKDISLGHKRLSIIDLKTGRQPISNEDDSILTIFNGEIYNFRALRGDLEKKGHKFRTNCDTEVIVHSYEEYGDNCVNYFNGMFAFAVWDRNRKRLFLARDRIGIKPLYYYFDNSKLIFSSEIKSILKDKTIDKGMDEEALNIFLAFSFIPSPYTIFKKIRKLPQAHILIYEKNNITIKRYWNLKFVDTNYTENYYVKKIYEELKESVKKRMISDVPLGAFLSGGLDSSTIVCLMSELSEKPVKTFSIGFGEKSYSELNYAKIIADHFNTDHYEYVVDPSNVKLIEKVISHFDEPFADTSAIPTYLVSNMTRKNVTVALSGDGGDEMFAGYRVHLATKFWKFYKIIPKLIRRKIIFNLVNNLPEQGQKYGLINILKRFVQGSNLPEDLGVIRWRYYLDNKISSNLLKKNEQHDSINVVQKTISRCDSNSFNKQQYLDINLYLVDNNLVKVDRTSMFNSLEVRVPFLDHKFAEFVATIPFHLKLKGYNMKGTKYILKKAFSSKLPKEIVKRGKSGFGSPVKHWLKDELKDFAYNTLAKSEFLDKRFNKKYIEKIFKMHQKNKENYSHILWNMLSLSLWYQKYVSKLS